MVFGQFPDRLARNLDNLAGREGGDGVIHLLQDRDVQITPIPRHEIGHDLALAIGQELVAAGEALKHQMYIVGLVASWIRSWRGPITRGAEITLSRTRQSSLDSSVPC